MESPQPAMDFETGEGIPDQETGEMPQTPTINQETGEIECCYTQPQTTKKPFKIPSNLITHKKPKDDKVEMRLLFTKQIKPNSPIVLFLLPTLIFFVPGFIVLLGVVEIILHNWAHRKNKALRSIDIHNVFYQSPLHVIVREFCSNCQFETSKQRITKIQDKRNRRFIKYGLKCVKNLV